MEVIQMIWPQMMMLLLVYSLVLLVIFLDLWAGVRKAKARGEYRSSFGYRKTVDKIGKYFNMLFVITVIDVIQMLAIWEMNEQTSHSLPIIPFLTFIGAMFAGFIELKSIYEKNEDKEKAKINEVVRLAGQIAKERDTQDIVAAVVEYLKVEKEKNKNG